MKIYKLAVRRRKRKENRRAPAKNIAEHLDDGYVQAKKRSSQIKRCQDASSRYAVKKTQVYITVTVR